MPGTRNPVATAIIGLLAVRARRGARLQRSGDLRRRHHLPRRVQRGGRADVRRPGDRRRASRPAGSTPSSWPATGCSSRSGSTTPGSATAPPRRSRSGRCSGRSTLALDPQGERRARPRPAHPAAAHRLAVRRRRGVRRAVRHDRPARHRAARAGAWTRWPTTFRGTAPEVRGALDGLSRLSTTIASRDEEIRTLLAGTRNLSEVLADRNAEVEKLLSDGNLLLAEIQRRRDAISALLDGTIALSEQLRGLVADNREQLRPTLEQLDRVAALLQRNKDNLERGAAQPGRVRPAVRQRHRQRPVVRQLHLRALPAPARPAQPGGVLTDVLDRTPTGASCSSPGSSP